jgi:membrane-associated phospholipid phosphatase
MRRWLGIAGFLSLAVSAAAAQAPTTISRDPKDTTHAQTQAPFFTKKDALLGGGFALATVAMFPLDKQIAQHFQDSVKTGFFKHASTGVEVIASPGAYIIGGGLYLIGRVGKYDRIADLGWHGSEAVLLAEGITYLIKGVAGRSRPFVTGGKTPDDFDLGQGFRSGNLASFPSGHSSTAFAAAAAVTNETTRWWPSSTWIVGPIMYGGATAVGLSRMYHNRHWASDVALGAAIGTFSGRKVVQYMHGHPSSRLDRIMLRTAVVPDGQGGQMLMVSVPVGR